ncbi:MAG: tetratricopeptide repeat protein, partial [Acidobacteriia bacterium]|nr:tetratricopeptide repeat protein [Terriglobia bacterium]
HNLSGATKARLLVINTASEYLNRLAAEAGGDRQLRRELADAYKKLADIQGEYRSANIGQFQQAVASYQKALALRDSLGDERSVDPKVQAAYLSNLTALAAVERFAGNPANGDRLRSKAVGLADQWLRSSAPDGDLLGAAALVYNDLASAERLREEFPAARASAGRNVELAKQAYALDSKNAARLQAIATAHLGAGYVELDAGQYAGAIEEFQQGNRLLDQLLTDDPRNAALRRQRMTFVRQIGDATEWLARRKKQGKQSDALPFFEQAYRIGSELAAEDPTNDGLQTALADVGQSYGSLLQMMGRPAEALPLLTRGMDYYSRHLKEVPSDTNAAFNLAIMRVWTSDTRRDLHDLKGALEESKKADEIWDRLLKMRPGTYRYLNQKADNLNTMGNLLAQMGHIEGARRCLRAGLDIAERLPKQDASYSTTVVVNELRKSEEKLSAVRVR